MIGGLRPRRPASQRSEGQARAPAARARPAVGPTGCREWPGDVGTCRIVAADTSGLRRHDQHAPRLARAGDGGGHVLRQHEAVTDEVRGGALDARQVVGQPAVPLVDRQAVVTRLAALAIACARTARTTRSGRTGTRGRAASGSRTFQPVNVPSGAATSSRRHAAAIVAVGVHLRHQHAIWRRPRGAARESRRWTRSPAPKSSRQTDGMYVGPCQRARQQGTPPPRDRPARRFAIVG